MLATCLQDEEGAGAANIAYTRFGQTAYYARGFIPIAAVVPLRNQSCQDPEIESHKSIHPR